MYRIEIYKIVEKEDDIDNSYRNNNEKVYEQTIDKDIDVKKVIDSFNQ